MVGEKKSVSSAILWISIRTLVNVVLILFLVEGFVNGYHFSYKLFSDVPYVALSSDVVNVTIESGASVFQVAEDLEAMGIVDGKYIFIARAYIGDYHDKIISGDYVLGPGMSPDEICKKICGIQSEEAS